MLRRVLIANRGEIAARIARTCKRLNVEYVAVFSDADKHAPHLQEAAATIHLGGSLAAESYLNASKLIQGAIDSECDAIHPGYGFLSENAEFARQVADAGITFIGPRPDTIESLGDKARAKALMNKAGVPTVPGTETATEDIDSIVALACQMGFPVLLKPTAGGGGKGMQIVYAEKEIRGAAEQAIRLARANFKDGRLLVERFVENPRHIEVQIFGDAHGNVVHVFERECSLQRRHQKVIEEAPATSLSDETRAALLDAAVRGASALNYLNAGTFEFIVGQNGDFFFLEVNTRLQVEHPVSEEITGIDFVEWQLRIASGEPLPLRQDAIEINGHAIECRIYAEDLFNDFRPCPGTVTALSWPESARIETAIALAGEVSPFYDPMIAKLIVHGTDRAQAIEKARCALQETVILGLTTNLDFLIKILSDPQVQTNSVHTRYLDQNLVQYTLSSNSDPAIACAAAIQVQLSCPSSKDQRWPWSARSSGSLADRAWLDPTISLGKIYYWAGSEACCARLTHSPDMHSLSISTEQGTYAVTTAQTLNGTWRGYVNDKPWYAMESGGQFDIVIEGHRTTLERYENREPAMTKDDGLASALMPGVVVALPVSIGDQIKIGTTLAIVEAMKMETSILAAKDGIVTTIHCHLGDSVQAGDTLVSIQ